MQNNLLLNHFYKEAFMLSDFKCDNSMLFLFFWYRFMAIDIIVDFSSEENGIKGFKLYISSMFSSSLSHSALNTA